MIQDIGKSEKDGYKNSFSIGLIFPFQSDENLRNNTVFISRYFKS